MAAGSARAGGGCLSHLQRGLPEDPGGAQEAHGGLSEGKAAPGAPGGGALGQLLMGHLSAAAGRPEVPALPEAVQVQGRPQLPHHGRAQCQGTPGPSRLPPASLNPRPPPPRPPRPPGPQRTVPALGPPRPRHGRGRSAEAGPAPQPSDTEAPEGSEQEERERLRKVLKQMGRLRCPQEVGAALQGRGMGGVGAAWGSAQPPQPPSAPRVVGPPSPASWATSTTSGAAGSRPARWTARPSPAPTAARPTAPRPATTTTCGRSTRPR